MTDSAPDRFEARLWEAAREFPYPLTPDLSRARARRMGKLRPLAVALASLAIMLAALLAVPSVRAGVMQFLQVGAVRIFVGEPTPTAAVSPGPTPPSLGRLLNLTGETSLAQLKGRLGFIVRLPQYPAGLGPPDAAFAQDLAGPAVILVWRDPADPARLRLALHELSSGALIEKAAPVALATTAVHGQPAIWTTGPYIVQAVNQDLDFRYTVLGHVLIWSEGGVTYRLETGLTLDEAVKIAESLK
jgi:hypothetical protein